MNIVSSALTAFLTLAALLQGIVALTEIIKHSGHPKRWLISISICVVLAIISGSISYASSLPKNPGPNATATSSAISQQNTPASTATAQLPALPTDTPTALPTSTPSPTFSGPETLFPNKTLECNPCSDPILVKIVKIIIEPQQDSMLWSLTFSNTSQITITPYFQIFSLEEGNQITDPTGPGEQTYNPTGTTIRTADGQAHNLYLQAGDVQQVTLTFSFVPYKDFTYTLATELKDFNVPLDLTFTSLLFSF